MRLKGSEVKMLRERLGGISQDELADLIRTSQSKVSRWERKPDENVPWIFARRIRGLLRRVKSGRPLRDSEGMPANVIELIWPDGASGPRVWIEDVRARARARKEKPSPPEGVPPSAGEESPPVVGAPASQGALAWAGVAASLLFVGCFVRADVPQDRARELCAPEPDEIYAESGKVALAEDKSIPMPSEPYPWQKRAPCDMKKGESEKVSGCWSELKTKPPCPSYAVEDAGRCVIPVPTRPYRRPSTVTPK